MRTAYRTRSDLSQSNSSNKKATALRGIETAAWVHPEHDGFVKYSERAGPSLLGLRTSLIVVSWTRTPLIVPQPLM
jgi:hypothetical protein